MHVAGPDSATPTLAVTDTVRVSQALEVETVMRRRSATATTSSSASSCADPTWSISGGWGHPTRQRPPIHG
ncbi:hypothetical protein FrEUN1fDRAFT_7811 [Parafrankia sp. EUN1f]|nr:hypothetical protein FrEUN1fDRAFT_7811 [Parafrankia sp. EUN1f]